VQTSNSAMNELPGEDLRQLLRTWEVSPSSNPDFAAAVWRRIALEEARACVEFWPRVRDWLLCQLSRPAVAMSVLAATIVLTSVVATLHANHNRDEKRIENARLYLASIDPLAMASNSTHPPR